MDITRNGGVPSQPTKTVTSRARGWIKSMRIASIVLLFSGTVLVVALLFSFVTGANKSNDARLVDTSKYQAVFLINQQLPYFAKITHMNEKTVVIEDIYYLSVNQPVQPKTEDSEQNANNIQLIKLGCELHGPEDHMIINKDQIVFWENLKTDGKVAKAIAEFKTKFPNGLECNDTSSQPDNE